MHKDGGIHVLMVRKPVLLFTVGILCLIAGVNILRIGVVAFSACVKQETESVWLLAVGALLGWSRVYWIRAQAPAKMKDAF